MRHWNLTVKIILLIHIIVTFRKDYRRNSWITYLEITTKLRTLTK